MGSIRVLGFEIANLIAAGEVVDRPASVLKELLENALDAGATRVTAEIRNGGVSLIRVTDNGSGMTPEDLPVAIRRHATSKISSADDLASIMTLGFRGEALAAIASVSELTIISKTRDSEVGTLLVADGGNVTEISEVGCADGTTVSVKNLFGKVPARRKFLKKDATEAAAVSAMVEKLAMSRPDVAFTLIIDGNEKFSTAGDGNLKNALYALLGRDFATRLIAVSGESDGIAVSGFVGRSDNARGNRNAQNLFINGRYVKSKTVTAALERAYASYLAPEKFPVAALFLTCNPLLVDVNVHPAKLEVRFSNEQAVFEAVYHTVRAALAENQSRPALDFSKPRGTTYRVDATPIGGELPTYRVPLAPARPAAAAKEGQGSKPFVETASPAASLEALRRISESASSATARSVLRERPMPVPPPVPKSVKSASEYPVSVPTPDAPIPTLTEKELPRTWRLAGEIFRTYLLIEDGETLLLVDQHAAHERILFEEMLAAMKRDGRVLSQEMLLPLSVELTDEELTAAEEARDDIQALGFSFAPSRDRRAALVFAIPDAIAIPDAEMLFAKTCAELAEGMGTPGTSTELRRERALYGIACKAAIKGGRAYDRAHLEWLAERVMALPDITVCPHGRPIAVSLTKGELDRRFDRIK